MIHLKVPLMVYIILTILLLVTTIIVFRKIIRKDYFQKGYLTRLSSSLQMVVFAGFFVTLTFTIRPNGRGFGGWTGRPAKKFRLQDWFIS